MSKTTNKSISSAWKHLEWTCLRSSNKIISKWWKTRLKAKMNSITKQTQRRCQLMSFPSRRLSHQWQTYSMARMVKSWFYRMRSTSRYHFSLASPETGQLTDSNIPLLSKELMLLLVQTTVERKKGELWWKWCHFKCLMCKKVLSLDRIRGK